MAVLHTSDYINTIPQMGKLAACLQHNLTNLIYKEQFLQMLSRSDRWAWRLWWLDLKGSGQEQLMTYWNWEMSGLFPFFDSFCLFFFFFEGDRYLTVGGAQMDTSHIILRVPRGTIGIKISLIKEMSVHLGHPTWQSSVYYREGLLLCLNPTIILRHTLPTDWMNENRIPLFVFCNRFTMQLCDIGFVDSTQFYVFNPNGIPCSSVLHLILAATAILCLIDCLVIFCWLSHQNVTINLDILHSSWPYSD